MNHINFHYKKFLDSVDVKSMDVAEIGAYCLLLFNSIDQKQKGYLPDDEESLQRIARMNDEQWTKGRKRLMKKFKHSEKGYYNEVMVREISAQIKELELANSSNKISEASEVDMDKKMKEPHDEVHPLRTYVASYFENVKRIKNQLTEAQCKMLLDKFSSKLIKEKLIKMENKSDIGRYQSVYITLLEWCEKEVKR